jgi:hypothetical protein
MSANALSIENLGRRNSPRQVLLASLIGTTIEFFDLYIYSKPAVPVFPALFSPLEGFSARGGVMPATMRSFTSAQCKPCQIIPKCCNLLILHPLNY